MADGFKGKGRAIPSGRLSRLGAFGRLGAGVAGTVVAEGARRLAAGERPRASDLLLTPANFTRLADQLSQLRGAAMKLGQMISLDAGDLLPPELSAIMARLRESAHHMPPAQLDRVLVGEWGRDWRGQFKRFGAAPVAAASIGQVHRATTRDGRELAIKVQYPGVAQSIDADIDNVATLLRLSGLLPKSLDIAPLLAEAKRQLHEEADYVREGEQLTAYGERLAGEPGIVVPALAADFSRPRILAMSWEEGVPVERLEGEPQAERDRVMALLIALVLRELFAFGVMQTDPNFANYRYRPATGQLVLLDFGATRALDPGLVEGYRRLLFAALDSDREGVRRAAVEAGFIGAGVVDAHGDRLDTMIDVIFAELAKPGPFDFGDRGFVTVLRDQGLEIAQDRATWHLPPAAMLLVQRKISGTALLAARLRARVDVKAMVEAYR